MATRPNENRGPFQHKFGYNPDLTAPMDITPWGDSYWPDDVVLAADIDIVSSSVQDKGTAPAGAGAQAMKIFGLDADYKEIFETVILDGQTDVHPTKDYLRIYRLEVEKQDGAGNQNLGTITVDINDDNTMAAILPTFSKTTQLGYTIPANYSAAWLLDFDAEMVAQAAGKFAQGYLQIKKPGGVWAVEHVFGITSEKSADEDYSMNLEIVPMSDLRVRIFQASASGLFISGSMGIFLEG